MEQVREEKRVLEGQVQQIQSQLSDFVNNTHYTTNQINKKLVELHA
jgi:hypothetical protein